MNKRALVYQTIKWEKVPVFPVYEEKRVRPGQGVSRSIGYDSTQIPVGIRKQPLMVLKTVVINTSDCMKHGTKVLPRVRDQYRDAGFATGIILQDPRTHRGPTTSCTIGFPTNLPRKLWTEHLRIFKRFVCRVHVDIIAEPDRYIWSMPHVEPDPIFHWKEHIEYSTIKHLDVRGRTAVSILRHFLNL